MRKAKDLLYWEEAVASLMAIIDRTAIEIQKEPFMMFSAKMDADDIKLFNNNIAAYNRGAMKMRDALLEALAPIPEEEEKDE